MIIWLLIGYCAYLLLKNRSRQELPREKTKGEDTHLDPVCGMYVAVEDAVVGKLEGERFYFCSMACLEKYREQLENKS